MRKRLIIFLLYLVPFGSLFCQLPPEQISRIKNQLNASIADTVKFRIYLDLSQGYRFSNIDSAIHYTDKAIELAQNMNSAAAQAEAYSQKGFIVLETGDLPLSLQSQFKSLSFSEKATIPETEAFALNRIGNIYMELGEYKKAIDYYRKAIDIFTALNKTGYVYNEMSNIGNVYELMGVLDSSEYYQQQVYTYSLTNTDRYAITYAEMRDRLGNVERRLGKYDIALDHYKAGIAEAFIDNDFRNLASVYLQLAKLFQTLHQSDSSFIYAKRTIETAKSVSWKKAIYEASGLLSALFKEKHQTDSALFYTELSAAIKDSLYGAKKFQQLQLVMLNEQQRQQQLIEEKDQLQERYRLIAFLSVLSVIILIAFILWRNSRREHRTNLQLKEQKEEITVQRNNLENTLEELRSAQTQLIHSEKMASLGQLTAGIAHEIQNPLNFVNNFSEVSEELTREMMHEINKGNVEEAKAIAGDLVQNLEKINHHGKRADAIVKGMLQHSSAGTGHKEPADINTLADEYLKLAYHGLRAKDKSFNAILKTDFDAAIGKINIIPQDMGRVLLNLYNNAFYAVSEKKKNSRSLKSDDYEPVVAVSTMKLGNKIEIKVKDNGNGIPQHLIDKIFQPFFTTKPTGEGTGLGLSLAYDIIKAHGGEIKATSKEGEGSVFIIVLPG